MAAESDFLQSTVFEEAAEERAGNNDSVKISVGDIEARISPSLIRFTATSASPDQAAETAQTWADTYIELRHEADVSENVKSVETLETTAAALEAERTRVLAPLEPLDSQLEETENPDVIGRLSSERLALLQTLSPQLQPIDAQLTEINAELADQRLVQEFLEDPNASARVNRLAIAPTKPSSPSIPQNIALGIVAGALLSAGAVLAAASFDDKVRTADEVEEALGLGPLTTVPNSRNNERPITLPEGTPTAESFQRLISSVDFTTAAGHSNKVLLVTSPEKSEGKSTTSALLALALANEGRYVIVVGGDLRRPALSQLFRAPTGPGLSDYLAEDIPLEQCLHGIRPTLAIFPSGTKRSKRNPAELLRSKDLLVTIDKLRDHCDHIIIDAPPVLPVVDALELAEVTDGVILCAYARQTRKRALQEAQRRLLEANSPPTLGFVLTGVSETRAYKQAYSTH